MNNLVSILLQVADEFYWKGLHADVKQLCQQLCASFNNSWRFGSVVIARQRKILLVHRKGKKSSMMPNMML